MQHGLLEEVRGLLPYKDRNPRPPSAIGNSSLLRGKFFARIGRCADQTTQSELCETTNDLVPESTNATRIHPSDRASIVQWADTVTQSFRNASLITALKRPRRTIPTNFRDQRGAFSSFRVRRFLITSSGQKDKPGIVVQLPGTSAANSFMSATLSLFTQSL